MKKTLLATIITILAIALGLTIGLAIEGGVCMFLVNTFCALFGLAFSITFWQALIVAMILNFIGNTFNRTITLVNKEK